jgi:hypothetical protein
MVSLRRHIWKWPRRWEQDVAVVGRSHVRCMEAVPMGIIVCTGRELAQNLFGELWC